MSYQNPHKEGCQQRYRLDGICSCGMDDQDIVARATQPKEPMNQNTVTRETRCPLCRFFWPDHEHGCEFKKLLDANALLESALEAIPCQDPDACRHGYGKPLCVRCAARRECREAGSLYRDGGTSEIDELRSQKAALESQLAETEHKRKHLSSLADLHARQLAELHDKLAEARKDTERLDWLHAYQRHLSIGNYTLDYSAVIS